MRGIYINGKHTGNDMGLVMTEKDIGTPVVQTYKVDVPGRNGSLDLSEFLTGDVCYSNRDLKFKFLADGSREKILTAIDEMMLFHGQQAEIISDDYLDSYYKGRISISHKDYGPYAEFEMSVDAEPFRMAREKSAYSFDLSSDNPHGKKCMVVNKGMPVVATVTATKGSIHVNTGGSILGSLISEGKYTHLKLKHGTNAITCFGIGAGTKVTFEFTEAFI